MAKRQQIDIRSEREQQLEWSDELDSAYGSDMLLTGDGYDDDFAFLTVADPVEPHHFVFCAMVDGENQEIIRFDQDGHFYVRGVKVDADYEEAKAVYNAFKEWLEKSTKP